MDEGSIFDHAGDQYKDKGKGEKSNLLPNDPNQQKTTMSDREIRELFEKVYKLNDIVAKKLDEAYNFLGLSHTDIKNYLENPSNFKDNAQWEKVQKLRDNMLGRLEKKIVYGSGGRGASDKIQESKRDKKKKEDAADKKRKGKTLGSRKGWMSM